MGADRERLDEQQRLRAQSVDQVVNSTTDKKLIVSGAGTGKTFTFREALLAGGGRGLALTFIRNLVADLEQALGDIADVFTFHGFCKHLMHRHPVSGLQEGWHYYPPLLELIAVDLSLLGRAGMTKSTIERCLHDLDGTERVVDDAMSLGDYYNAVSHTDLVYRVLRHFEANTDAIPTYPLIVVDEYQDFSRLETSFIGLLAGKSRVLIAGDDDQALYAFKNASARYIRELAGNTDFERFELPYCSRCTAVIVEAVKDVIEAAVANGNLVGRLDKEFHCYLPDKQADSEAHPTIIHATCTVERGNAPYVGRYITQQIARIPVEDIRESHEKDYPTVLVIGPNPFLKRAHDIIAERFTQAKMKTAAPVGIEPLDAYRLLAGDPDSRLGRRIIIHCDPFENAADVLRQTLADRGELSTAISAGYRQRHLEIAALVRQLFDDLPLSDEDRHTLEVATAHTLAEIKAALAIIGDDDEPGDPEQDGLEAGGQIDENEPTIICTSLVGAKGLSAGYVFIVGFNNEHFPRNAAGITDEEVCCFIVGLSRTRRQCYLISCQRLGNQRLGISAFADWIDDHVEEVTVNAAYFQG